MPIHQPCIVVLSCQPRPWIYYSHSVRVVELEEKDTESGDKDKVQLDDLTDRVIVWLT